MISNTPLLDKTAVSWKTYIKWTADCFQTTQACIVVKVWILFTLKSQIKNGIIPEQLLRAIMSNFPGHLMGKKSIESLPELRETDSDYLTPSETARLTELDRYQALLEALMQQKNQQQMMPKTANDVLLRLRSGWREEEREYLREVGLWIVPPLL